MYLHRKIHVFFWEKKTLTPKAQTVHNPTQNPWMFIAKSMYVLFEIDTEPIDFEWA